MYIILHNRTIKHLTLFKMVPINLVDMLEQNQKDSWVFHSCIQQKLWYFLLWKKYSKYILDLSSCYCNL